MPASGSVRSIATPVVALALGLTLISAGCAADADTHPTSTPTASPAPTPSPTPSPTPAEPTVPDRPPAMSTASADGAAAAAAFAIEVLNHAAASGDVSAWRDITAPSCRMCTAFGDDIVAAGPDGGSLLAVTSATGREVEAGRLYAAELTVTQPASPDGSSPAGSFVFQVALSHGGDWKVEAIDVYES
ncbi:DUF6318 family protein [Cellulomonas wangsupingiae]|uniref:DUF6318 family protein n=1 Tax=Cellulomonas wangsupingiae TaxID=2968085 RepID=A0ABY5K652_9CELL|nr:DUF6318 family protein [Cellulomonas wangsupingiae]MCC2333618.1 DUF6318 family protein [Cellulomonas wangsupingiae]UUI64886.1 DUF6318 family protein [Cellulomonas wangsupingiae]